ncbi:MAG: PPC domain-containing protein [Gemmatimonadetes bacterium]|nr:PPC domain-containing protein [Gemmatimonadota bacterium]
MSRPSLMAAARPLALVLGLVAVAARPASAQQIAVGQMMSGTLTMADPVFTDGTHYKQFFFYGQAGQTVQIDVMSSDFDAFCLLLDQNNNELARDDDSGEGLNARITRTLSYPGMYRIVVNSYRSGAYGNFTVSLAGSGGMPVAVAPVPTNPTGVIGTISANQQVTGNLTVMDARWDGKPFQAYSFSCMAGQAFQMDILSSWDNYAMVFDPMGNVVARDDDTGEGLNARVNYACPMAGVYRLAVTTYTSSTQPGQYTMMLQSAMPAMVMAPQPAPIPQPIPQPGVTLPAAVPQAYPITGAIPAPGQVGTAQVGATVQGRLETGDQQMNDGTWADVWQFQGFAGQAVTLELRSEEFDTYLQLLDAAGNRLAEDDDSLGDLDSRIVWTLPATGTYQLVVNNFGDTRRAGIYTLTLR